MVKQGKKIYGITTGFGALSNIAISKQDTAKLQKNILMSHSAGTGRPFPQEVVRVIMALRLNDFCQGYSGIRLKTAKNLAELLNHGVIPVVPEKGSVGASGDLVPMAHMGLCFNRNG